MEYTNIPFGIVDQSKVNLNNPSGTLGIVDIPHHFLPLRWIQMRIISVLSRSAANIPVRNNPILIRIQLHFWWNY